MSLPSVSECQADLPLLAGLAEEITESVGQPHLLDGRIAAYLVTDGSADLFAVRRRIGAEAASHRHFLARVGPGTVVPSSGVVGTWQLAVVPLPDSKLHAITSDRLRPLGFRAAEDRLTDPGRVGDAFARALDVGLLALADALRAGQPPTHATVLGKAQIVSLAEGTMLTGGSRVGWLRVAGGRLRRNGGDCTAVFGGPELVLLAGQDWVLAEGPCTVEAVSTAELLAAGQLPGAIDQHMVLALRAIETRIAETERAFLGQLQRRKRGNAAVVSATARHGLRLLGTSTAGPVGPAADEDSVDLYGKAAAVLRALLGAEQPVSEPVDRSQPPADEFEAVKLVARSSSVYLRPLKLADRWWRNDFGRILAWRPDGPEKGAPAHAVPLLYRRGRYHRIDPETKALTPVTRQFAATLRDTGTQVQLPLRPNDSLWGLLRHGVLGGRRDAVGMLLAGVVVAALGLATPLVTGSVLGAVATSGAPGGLGQASVLFVVSAVVAALAGVVQNLRLLRLEGRAAAGTQLALWDRLMRLPVRFFTKVSTGELANTVLGVLFIREMLSGLLAQAMFAVLTVLVGLVFLTAISPLVGLAAGVVLVAVVGLTVLFGALVVRRQRRALPAENHAAAFTNELLNGIGKIKLAAAGDRAFARWNELNFASRERVQAVRKTQSLLLAICTALPIAGQLVLFLVLAGPLSHGAAIGAFFELNLGFSVLLGALVVVVSTGVEVLATVPRLANLRGVVEAAPETQEGSVAPGELRGEVELNWVTFGYQDDQPPVLREVSLHVRPGEFVAVVGPSGCGKSTLLRLLLGFERPDSGSVLYDGQDLAELDVQAVRRQVGVVLQDGKLFAGSIRDNICGAGQFSLEQVWTAAKLAGVDEDIARLPMGMATMLPFGGGTLSVGQRQRVLIARALIGRPRVLFFDEATSALDNRTQEIVTASTRELAASRVVIAHRLSTIVDADRIVVLDAGRMVQEGSYADLLADTDGLFYRLARRQMVS